MASPSVYTLIPEEALIRRCPSKLRPRFLTALKLMHSEQGSELPWKVIAKEAGISSSHFHRQFSQLFFEAPAKYKSRQKLKTAVSLLIDFPKRQITDIAHDSGYASSQALAKALQRDLGISASQLRQLCHDGNFDQLHTILARLGQPSSTETMESELTDAMPLSLTWQSQRFLQGKSHPEFLWEQQLHYSEERLKQMATLTPVCQLNNCLSAIDIFAGNLTELPTTDGYTVAAGYYLTATVRVASILAYLAAWNTLCKYAANGQFSIAEQNYCIEQLLDFDSYSLTLQLQLPVLIRASEAAPYCKAPNHS